MQDVRSTMAPASSRPLPATVIGRVARLDTNGSGGVKTADGTVTSYSDGGGRILKNPSIILIFWGSAWANAKTSPSQAQFQSALTDIINGPWATQLSQYRGVNRLTLENVVSWTVSDPPTSFTDPDISDFLTARFKGGTLPAPDNNVDRIYAVLMPTGCSSSDNSGDAGQHQELTYNSNKGVWAWVTNDGTLTGGNSIPKVFSHEIAEAITDPELGNGIIVSGNQEIGDVCNSTWSTVNGHAEEAYWSQSDNRCVIPVWTPFPPVGGTPSLIQSRFGTKGNFELLASAGSGLVHFWRNNDNSFLPWSGAIAFGQAAGAIGGVSMIESNFGSPGNLEVVGVAGGALQFFWRDTNGWHGPFQIESGVAGNPSMVQSRFGTKGNFEVVVPAAQGGLVHFWRNNDANGLPWSGATPFGQAAGTIAGVSMIESNFASPGNLEVVAVAGGALKFFWRDTNGWHGPFQIEGGVSGTPSLIQSHFGTKGNFEVVVPSAQAGLIHFWRNNDANGLPWSGPTPFGQGLGKVDAVTLIESNYNSPGNLEVVARVGTTLQFFWRDPNGWNGPFQLQSTTW